MPDKTCSFCSSTLLYAWKDRSFYRCPSCGLLIRNSEYSQSRLDKLYNNSWEAPMEKLDETGGTTESLAKQYVDALGKELAVENFAGLTVVDYGAGRGDMTLALQKAGATVYTVEPYGKDYLESLGFQAYSTMDELPDSSQIDGVVSLDVVEHLVKPWEDLQRIRERIKPGGWVFISTPNCQSLNVHLTGSEWREARREGHLFLYNSKSLTRQLESGGYKQVRQLYWNIQYEKNPLLRSKDFILAKLHLDGELRFIAYR